MGSVREQVGGMCSENKGQGCPKGFINQNASQTRITRISDYVSLPFFFLQTELWLKMFLKCVSPLYEDLRPVRIFLCQPKLCHRPAVCPQESHLTSQDPTTVS